MKTYRDVSVFLHSIGWESPRDAQWTKLRGALPDLLALLKEVVEKPPLTHQFRYFSESGYASEWQDSDEKEIATIKSWPNANMYDFREVVVPMNDTDKLLRAREEQEEDRAKKAYKDWNEYDDWEQRAKKKDRDLREMSGIAEYWINFAMDRLENTREPSTPRDDDLYSKALADLGVARKLKDSR